MAKNTNDSSKEKASATQVNKASGLKKYLNLTQEEKISYSIVALLVFLIMIIRSKFYEIPFERDEGAYSYYGKLLLEGKTPYKDFYEQKFPGIFYFFATIVAIFGDTVKGMHMGFMYVNIITMLFLFAASKRLFSPMAGVITAITFTIVSLTPGLSGFTVQGEHAVAFFTSIGLFFYSYTVTHKHWKYYLFMGLAFGCAFMTKTSGMFLALWGGLVTITDHFFSKEKRPFKQLLIRGFIYTGGVLLVIGIMFGLILMKGSFKEMLFWTFEIPQKYVNKIQWEQGKTFLDYMYKSITQDYKIFWAHGFFALIFVFFKNIKASTRASMPLLIALSSATIFPGFYFYGHYWIQILPGLSLLSGFMFYAITTTLNNRFGIKWSKLPHAYLAIFVLLSLMHLNKKKDYYFYPNYERIMRTVYGNNPFPESMAIANYINANSKPEDGIVVMGSEPQIYFYTKKKCPSRHAYFAAIVDNVPEHKEWQREFVADVEKAAPKYFIFFNHGISLFVQPNTDKYVFEWYNKYIQNYNLIGCVDMLDGYSSSYAWKEQLANFKPQSQNVVYIYERKP